jgi:hypothetical protein
MADRIDAALEGQLPRDDMTVLERAELDGFEAEVGKLRGSLSTRMPRDLTERVMHRIRSQGLEPLPPSERPGLARRVVRSLWVAREVRVRLRPAYGLAAAAVIALLLIDFGGVATAPPRTEQATVAAAVTSPQIFVQFRLQADDARAVALAGSFTDWETSYSLQRTVDGTWTVLLPLAPGVHDYAFVIDDEDWVPDPYAPQVDDGFGGSNSRLTLLPAGA